MRATHIRCVLGAVALAAALHSFTAAAPEKSTGEIALTGRRDDQAWAVIGYYPRDAAMSKRFTVKDIERSGAADLLTQLDYAFGAVKHDRCELGDKGPEVEHAYAADESVDGTADPDTKGNLQGIFHQLQELKARHPRLKIVISFGGWGQSAGFPSAAEPNHRRAFVASCIQKFIEGQFAPGIRAPGLFDGIDLDWEYPVQGGVHRGRPEDEVNMSALAAEFRRQLDAVRPGLLLTAALPAEGPLLHQFELKALSRYLDQESIMAYDLHWNSEHVTNFHSALYHAEGDPSLPPADTNNADFAVRAFLAAGVPAKKIVLGVPWYGKGWRGVADVNHGLFQKAEGPAKAPGAYRDLAALPPTADRNYDAQAGSCTIWYQGNFWSYDCPAAMRQKVEYARRMRLGGVMFWELSQDSGDLQLLHTLAER